MAFVPVVLGAAELKVDHATIAGSDLKQMEARLAAVGIKAVYGGAHTNHATEMALVSFPEIDRHHGVYGDPSITVGNDTDVGGRIYVEGRDGRLHPTGRHRHA